MVKLAKEKALNDALTAELKAAVTGVQADL